MNHHSCSSRYEGLIPAAYTPFDPAGRLALEVVPRQAARFREDEAPAVFVAGTTGECHSLSTDERRLLTETWVDAAGDALDVIVHVGANARGEAVELARHARAIGARAVGCMAPSYFRPESVDDLVDFLAPIAQAADPLPFYFYDIPALTGGRSSNGSLSRDRGAADRQPRGREVHQLRPDAAADLSPV